MAVSCVAGPPLSSCWPQYEVFASRICAAPPAAALGGGISRARSAPSVRPTVGPTHERRVGRATNAPPEVLRLLLAAEGAAAAVRAQTNATGQLPLHVAVVNLAPREILAPLVDDTYGGCAAGAATRDKYGHTPASYAVLYFKPGDLTKSNHARQEARKTVRLLEDAAAAPLPSMPPDGQRRRASVFAK